MNSRQALIAAALCFPFACYPQETSILPLKFEPHHRLVLHNKYVNVYSVKVQPHDFVRLHKHKADAISIMLSNSEITVHAPGKPDLHQKVVNGQLRLQLAGYVHSTSIDGDSAYRNVTVELLVPQQSPQNLCAAVIAAQTTNCPEAPAHFITFERTDQPQFQTAQTDVALIRISLGQSSTLEKTAFPQLLVVLDDLETEGGNTPKKVLRAGDFLWRDANTAARVFKSVSPSEARIVAFSFKNEKSEK
jgi:hypothetical protein